MSVSCVTNLYVSCVGVALQPVGIYGFTTELLSGFCLGLFFVFLGLSRAIQPAPHRTREGVRPLRSRNEAINFKVRGNVEITSLSSCFYSSKVLQLLAVLRNA